MADDTDYEILPHELLANLKYDVEALKKKLTEPDTKINELMLEIESLKDSIHELGSLFQKALQEMKEEDSGKQLQNIIQKMDAVVSQNETIAQGVIAIADKVENFIQKQSVTATTVSPLRGGAQHSMGMPPLGGVGRMAPPPMMEMPAMRNSDDLDFPPPPPGMGKKKVGLFK